MGDIRTSVIHEFVEAVRALDIKTSETLDGTTTETPLTLFKGFPLSKAIATPLLAVRCGRLEKMATLGEIARTEDVPGEPDKVTVVWREDRREGPLTLELFTTTLTQRQQIVPLLEGLFYDPTGHDGNGCHLELTSCLDAPARVRWLDDDDADEDNAEDGIRRLTIRCEVHTEKLSAVVFDRAEYIANTTIE